MNTENNEPREYKRYDGSFKRPAVEFRLQDGKSVEQIAREPGISNRSLKPWRKQLQGHVTAIGRGVKFK